MTDTGAAASPPGASTAELARAGFAEPKAAVPRLGEVAALLGLGSDRTELVRDLAATADPDMALLGLLRVLETDASAVELLEAAGAARTRVLTLLGASQALTDHLVRHPEHLADVADPQFYGRGRTLPVESELFERLQQAVQGCSGREGMDALRVAYHRELALIAVADLTAPDPTDAMPWVSASLSDLAGAAIDAAVTLARAEVPEADGTRLAVIGLGKCGGRELNYISDVDVIFVAEPAADAADGAETTAITAATALGSAVMRICAEPTGEGSLWQVDANLRPEGRNGPLVRSLASYREYYQRWAKAWEFQALLKARVIAGDRDLGGEWIEAITPMVWDASSREGFVGEVQAMRRRVEEHVPPREAGRQLKLGPGGLRDIEFSVQLLQLVHGRSDEALRSGSTREALAALRDGGYVGRGDATELDEAYRFLRVLEHKVQLHRLKRTHLMPTAPADLRRLGRALGERGDAETAIVQRWRSQQREVRRLHERLFYRPLLAAVARLSPDEARLSPESARERLGALGFRDPAGAMRHLEALTDGVSRRATIQRHLLPVMLGWFADGADPDAGLLAFRRISEALGTTHWYLAMLRDEGSAAERLAHVLSSSRYAVDLLVRSPESVALLGDPSGLQVPGIEVLQTRMSAAETRHKGTAEAFAAMRSLRARELLRIVLADLVGGAEPAQVRGWLADLTDLTLRSALRLAAREVAGTDPLGVRLLVVGMGSLGAREFGYTSDADVMFVFEPDGLTGSDAADRAAAVVATLRRMLSTQGTDPPLELDASLRPEGRAGPLVRSLESYRTYYSRWSAGWESQALIRARPVAGDDDLATRFTELIDPLRWPAEGLDQEAVVTIRTLKARMESERLPRGADVRTHFKLGYGGLTDVEWVAQTLQLRHAHEFPQLRTTSTMTALRELRAANLLTEPDAAALMLAWSTATRLRDAGVLWRGRSVDSVPSDVRDAEGISRILGREAGRGGELAEEWRRTARRCRRVFERVFYDDGRRRARPDRPPGSVG